MNSLAAIHVARKQLGLDEDTYRDVLLRVTDKSSSRDMSEAERQLVIAEFRRLGFEERPSRHEGETRKGKRKKLDGRFAPKLQALWIAGWNLGLIRNKDDAALVAFVKRQSGIDAVRFLRHSEDAAKAIEALKGWLGRAGVDWSGSMVLAPAGYRIAMAQARALGVGFGAAVREICGSDPSALAAESDWIPVMNELGKRLRARRSEAPS